MRLLVIDVGTSSVRASVLDESASVRVQITEPLAIDRSRTGIVEFDADALHRSVVRIANGAIAEAGKVDGVGIAAQRASTILFERVSAAAVGPAISWEDLRTTGQCLALRAEGLRLAPNQSATKLALLLAAAGARPPETLCFGTVESFLAYCLTGGAVHVTDATNAALTGLVTSDATQWDAAVLAALRIPEVILPDIVDTSGVITECTVLKGAPLLAALVGDQQASLVGQGCFAKGAAKVTFGTGAMLDVVVGTERPPFAARGQRGAIPIVTRRIAGTTHWGLEAVMLAAGSAVAWLRDGLGLVASVEETDALAASARDAGGVAFVPALSGIGAPEWDFGARGLLVGFTGATTKAEVVRAVLEGIAQRGADLLESVEAELDVPIAQLHVDGGMSANRTFLGLLASATGRVVVPSAVREATTLGAAFLAGAAIGLYPNLEETAELLTSNEAIEPGLRVDRKRWLELRGRALGVVPALSALSF